MDWQAQDQWMLLATVSLGAFLMYVFDSVKGPYRRAWLREHLIHSIHRCQDALAATWQEVRNQARDFFVRS